MSRKLFLAVVAAVALAGCTARMQQQYTHFEPTSNGFRYATFADRV